MGVNVPQLSNRQTWLSEAPQKSCKLLAFRASLLCWSRGPVQLGSPPPFAPLRSRPPVPRALTGSRFRTEHRGSVQESPARHGEIEFSASELSPRGGRQASPVSGRADSGEKWLQLCTFLTAFNGLPPYHSKCKRAEKYSYLTRNFCRVTTNPLTWPSLCQFSISDLFPLNLMFINTQLEDLYSLCLLLN